MKVLLALIVVSLSLALSQVGLANEARSAVWFCPDPDTPDLLEMFTRPALWRIARSRINVFKLGPQHFELKSILKRNSLQDLERVNAFATLRRWRIALASEEGAVKEWDCSGVQAARVTLTHINNVRTGHGNINLIAMDEPLVSGLGPCKLSLAEVAENTHHYIDTVTSASTVDRSNAAPLIGDIEPYPSFPVESLTSWIDTLARTGVRLKFFHLDIDLNYLHVHREIDAIKDLRYLQHFLIDKGIPFGIIVWSGHDPVDSDVAYYKDALELVRLIKVSVHLPNEIIFQSWVHRSPIGCVSDHDVCGANKCSAVDPPYCGESSVPINLPEGNPRIYSHTRLIIDSLGILEGQRPRDDWK
jgi:hypothetical protein